MWHKVAKTDDFAQSPVQTVELEGQSIAIFKIENKFYAIDAVCPHQGGPLGEGSVDGVVVTCPWHAWQVNMKTGQCDAMSDVCQKTFPTQIIGPDILVDI